MFKTDVLDYELSLVSAQWSGAEKRMICTRAVARTNAVRRRISDWTMELINGHEYFLTLSNRGALSILVVSFKFARVSYLMSKYSWLTARMKQKVFDDILCLFRSDWSLRWLDVCIDTDASEKDSAFAFLEGCRVLASEVERVSEGTRFKRSFAKSGWSVNAVLVSWEWHSSRSRTEFHEDSRQRGLLLSKLWRSQRVSRVRLKKIRKLTISSLIK